MQRFRNSYYGRRGWIFDASFGIVGGTGGLLPLAYWAPCPLHDLLDKDGTAFYAGILAALAALLGFAIAVITIVTGIVSTEPFASLRASRHYDAFWAAFVWAIRFVGAATFFSFIALFAGRYEALRLGVGVVMTALVLASASTLYRSGVTLEALLRRARDRQKPAPSNVVDEHPPFDVGSLE